MTHNADNEGNHVSESFAGARLGQADNVDAVEGERDALRLDGKGSSVANPGKDVAKGTRKRVAPVEKRWRIDPVAREDRDVVVGPPDSRTPANLRRRRSAGGSPIRRSLQGVVPGHRNFERSLSSGARLARVLAE
jgi:hypothetical protein